MGGDQGISKASQRRKGCNWCTRQICAKAPKLWLPPASQAGAESRRHHHPHHPQVAQQLSSGKYHPSKDYKYHLDLGNQKPRVISSHQGESNPVPPHLDPYRYLSCIATASSVWLRVEIQHWVSSAWQGPRTQPLPSYQHRLELATEEGGEPSYHSASHSQPSKPVQDTMVDGIESRPGGPEWLHRFHSEPSKGHWLVQPVLVLFSDPNPDPKGSR